MTSAEEKRHRKALLRELKLTARARAEAAMPLSKSHLRELLAYVDDAVATHGCEHALSLTHTRAFLSQHGLAEAEVVPWLNQYGGYCDCEVAANVTSEWAYLMERPEP